MEEAEGGGARTRERAARPRQASGTERGAGGGGATARTHSHTRAPTPPPAAPRPRGRAAAAGNGATCWRLSATARAPAALAPSPSVRGPASPAPTAPANPAARSHRLRPGERAFAFPTRGKRKSAAAAGCRPGLGGKASFFSFSSPWLLPAPAQLGGLEPLGNPPRGSAARAPKGDRQPAEPQGWSAPAKRRVARSVSH